MIDFKEIRSQNLTKELLLGLIEKIYNALKTTVTKNIMLNEFVDNMAIEKETNTNYISLMHRPISINDILIISQDGEFIVTPANILAVKENQVYFAHNKIKGKMNFFVTYKY